MKCALILSLIAGPALADGMSLPAGCTGIATVQAKDCTVTHYFRCDGDQDGWTRRVDLDEDGLSFTTQTDPEGRWIESVSAADGVVDTLGAERDPGSISGLLAEGRDDWDFLVESSDGTRQRYIGYDRLTGDDVTIDGVTLKGTEFSMRVENARGETLWTSEGHEYIAPQWHVFVGGERTIEGGGESFTVNGRPEHIHLPGDPGFLARRPIYGCGLMLSALEQRGT